MPVAAQKNPAPDAPVKAVYRVPNAETLKAIEELEAGGGKSFDSVEELFADLESDDEDAAAE